MVSAKIHRERRGDQSVGRWKRETRVWGVVMDVT
ncbi:hypothetical protein LINGRAHAP2_LOCUS30271 [Linum grandiflorum]